MSETNALLRKPEVERRTGRSYSSIRRDIARGTFPKPVQIGPRAIAWHEHEVMQWIASRPAASLPAPPIKRTTATTPA